MQTQLISSKLEVVINHYGAELCSVKSKSGVEYVWQAKPEVWARHAPVLFPIVGKLKNNTYNYRAKEYELNQHGLARDMVFECVERIENAALFKLNSSQETKQIYPFDFELNILYQLQEDNLSITYSVKNTSLENIFFSIGAHPAFKCPLFENEKWEDYYLLFENHEYTISKLNEGLISDEKQIIFCNNNKLFLSNRTFENDALVFESNQIQKVSLCSSISKSKITLTSYNWPYFGIWSKKQSKAFVCLEPWYGIADHENTNSNIEQKRGIIKLPPDQEFKANYSIRFESE